MAKAQQNCQSGDQRHSGHGQGQNWGRRIDAGISVFQTDEPAALLDYLKQAEGRH